MALTIRIPKTHPELNRRAAVLRARVIAETKGHKADELHRPKTRLEHVEGPALWEYVIEFPDASS